LPAFLYTFSYHLQAHGLGQCDHRMDDRRVLNLLVQTIDERLVDLQDIYWKTPQVTQRRVARTEVVYREPHSQAFAPPPEGAGAA
jgi:hypothetical protein